MSILIMQMCFPNDGEPSQFGQDGEISEAWDSPPGKLGCLDILYVQIIWLLMQI